MSNKRFASNEKLLQERITMFREEVVNPKSPFVNQFAAASLALASSTLPAPTKCVE